MSISARKLGVLATIAMALLLFAVVRPGIDTPTAEADLGSPGGITALPSAAPAFPGITNQGIPAIMPARGDGSNAVVAVFCDPYAELPFGWGDCARSEADIEAGLGGAITFEMTQLYGDDTLASDFAVGGTTLVCRDGAACDLAGAWWAPPGEPDGVVAVEVNGGGENEMIQVTGVDAIGESRSVQIVVVDTILAWGETGPISTASQQSPAFISYACDAVGTRGLTVLDAGGDFDDDGAAGLDDIFDDLYGLGFDISILGNKLGPLAIPDVDIKLLQCGGNSGSTFDDFVDFQTDKGIFTVDPFGVAIIENIMTLMMAFGVVTPPSLDFDCGEGKNIDTFDINSLAVWGAIGAAMAGLPTSGFSEGGCDIDFAGNGVVTTALLGTGEVGVATITAQQGGGVSPPRTINVTFTGEAAMSMFIDAPAALCITGDEFTVTVVDQDLRPVSGETVECTVEPASAGLAIIPQTGTTGSTGAVSMTLVPTGGSVVAGEELTLTCVLDRDRSVSASTPAGLSMTCELESVDLVVGCNPVASTYADGTAASVIGDAVAPPAALEAVWKFDPASATWQGYAPDAPQASDLASVDMLDAIFICVSEAATWSRPVI